MKLEPSPRNVLDSAADHADHNASFEVLCNAAARIGCDLFELPGERFRMTRSGIGRDFETRGDLVKFLRVVPS